MPNFGLEEIVPASTSAHWGNFWVALLRGTIPVQIKVWWSDHPWSVLYSSRAFRRYIILGVTPLNSKFQKFDNVTSLPGVTQQVANGRLKSLVGMSVRPTNNNMQEKIIMFVWI